MSEPQPWSLMLRAGGGLARSGATVTVADDAGEERHISLAPGDEDNRRPTEAFYWRATPKGVQVVKTMWDGTDAPIPDLTPAEILEGPVLLEKGMTEPKLRFLMANAHTVLPRPAGDGMQYIFDCRQARLHGMVDTLEEARGLLSPIDRLQRLQRRRGAGTAPAAHA